MEVKRLYNKEVRFLIAFISVVVILISAAFSYIIIRSNSDSFEKYLTSNNYNKLYSYIESASFSEPVFISYMDYNLGKDITIIDRIKTNDNITYKVKTSQGEKTINLTKKDKKYIWNFNDFTYNWQIGIPANAKIYVENEEVENKNGQALIESIPSGVYEVKVTMDNCNPYIAKIMSGQNIQIKLDLSDAALSKCKDTIEEYLKFKENAFNKRKIDNITSIDKNSGLYKEVVDEIEWLKTVDFKSTKSLAELTVVKGYLDEDERILIDVVEKWNVKIDNDGNVSEKIDEYKNTYSLVQGEKLIISQIKTNK
jgi:hypothetical protein